MSGATRCSDIESERRSEPAYVSRGGPGLWAGGCFYSAAARLDILQVHAACNKSLQPTADAFHVTGATIASWMNRTDEADADALVQLRTPKCRWVAPKPARQSVAPADITVVRPGAICLPRRARRRAATRNREAGPCDKSRSHERRVPSVGRPVEHKRKAAG